MVLGRSSHAVSATGLPGEDPLMGRGLGQDNTEIDGSLGVMLEQSVELKRKGVV